MDITVDRGSRAVASPGMGRRVTFVLDALRLGGAERIMLRWARWFAEQGADVEMVTLKGGGPLEAELGPSLAWIRLEAPRAALAVSALRRHLRRRRPEVVVSTLPHVNLSVATAVAFSGLPIRLVMREANDPRAEHALSGWMNLFRRRWVRWAYRRADVVVALTEGNARDLVDHLGVDPERVRVIPNPAGKAPTTAPAAPQGAPAGRPRLLCVARLAPQKDHAGLIEAFASLSDLPGASLVLVGGGRLRAELEARAQAAGIAHRVRWLGEQLDVEPWWAWADVLVLASRWEGFPNVLLEALARGVQVAATDCPTGPREILADGRYGFLAPVGQPAALAAAIRAAVDHPIPREDLLARARTFDIDVVGRDWMDAFGWRGVERGDR